MEGFVAIPAEPLLIGYVFWYKKKPRKDSLSVAKYIRMMKDVQTLSSMG